MRILVSSLLAIVLAGCGEGTTQQDATQNLAADDATNYQAEVLALPERLRNPVFFRAIRDAGLQCQEVVSAERVDDQNQAPTWRAQCDQNAVYFISILPDGTAQVVSLRR